MVSGYLPHFYQTDCGLKACWIHFDGVLAEAFYQAILEKKGNIIHPAVTSNCERLIKAVYSVYAKKDNVSEAVISKYLTDILTGLLYDLDVDEQKMEQRMRESIQYMNRKFGSPITVDELASMACLSKCYYIRRFSKITGDSPHSYLLNLRITHAKYFLKTTDMSVKEIAFACGFSAESNFNNAFRKIIGISPGKYRNSNP